jgi:hypothetical protein
VPIKKVCRRPGMRQVLVVVAVLLVASMAFGQATVVGGWATNLGWAGYYPAPPFIPVITTPSLTLQSFSPAPVGASNATFGLNAGATNSTLSIITPASSSSYTLPVWYGNGPVVATTVPEVVVHEGKAEREKKAFMETGVAMFGMGPGTAESVAQAKANRKPATHSYTNQDIDRINQTNGLVKWDGKTEHI